jgi:probable HAF family extracellular repeat protein
MKSRPRSFAAHRRLFAALVSLQLFASAALAQQQYAVTDLGTLGGGTAVPFGLNEAGQVAGYSFTAGGGASTRRAFLYGDGVMRDLGTLGGPVSDALGLGDAGQVVGRAAAVPGSDNSFAFLYRDGVMRNLGTLPSDLSSVALSVNDAGHVVGLSEHNSTPNPFAGYTPFYRGFLYRDGVMQDLSALLGGAPSRANDINDAGQVVGSFNFSPFVCGSSHAFLYGNGVMRDLGKLPGKPCSEGIAINDLGWVVGLSAASDWSSPRLFLYNGGGPQDLGGLGPHLGGRPWDINNAGQIVGSFSVTQHLTYAFLYSEGRLTDLNTLVPANLGWELRAAVGINDAGQIVCTGYRPGTLDAPHAFLLTPTGPGLVTERATNKALALDSVTFVRDPFPLTTEHNFSADRRTRIILFARNVTLAAGEPASAVTVTAEGPGGTHPLSVEHVGPVPGLAWLTQIVVRLPDGLGAGDVQLSISFRGATSNKPTISIRN